jgi:hypothetical protein
MTKQQALILLFVLIIVGGGYTLYVSQVGSDATVPLNVSNTNEPSAQSAAKVQAGATNASSSGAGQSTKSVSHTGAYQVPNGETEQFTIECTIDADGKIVNVVYTPGKATNPESREYMNKFARAFSGSLLVGTKIGEKQLSRVGGASLTTSAFNAAMKDLSTKLEG